MTPSFKVGDHFGTMDQKGGATVYVVTTSGYVSDEGVTRELAHLANVTFFQIGEAFETVDEKGETRLYDVVLHGVPACRDWPSLRAQKRVPTPEERAELDSRA